MMDVDIDMPEINVFHVDMQFRNGNVRSFEVCKWESLEYGVKLHIENEQKTTVKVHFFPMEVVGEIIVTDTRYA